MSIRQQRKAFQDVIERYLGQLSDLSQDEDASNELSLRPALDTFIEGLSSAFDRDDMSVITEPIRQSYGTPDYKLKTDKGFLIGYIEAKGLTKDLDDLPDRDAEQVERYRDAGKRFILTNHRDFWLYDFASDGRTVMLRDQITLLSKRDVEQGRPPKEADVDALHRLLDRFLRDARPDINTPEQLAERLAAAGRHLCDELRKAYDAEGESGHLHGLKQAFEEILIPDIDRDQFTDMYAQTLAYGLFAAAVNHQGPELLNLDNAWRDIPKTNKFLRRLFESVTGSALEDKPYKWIIEDLLDLFNGLDMMAILEGFGRRPAGQDPIVHFYEDFLAAYDPELREKRGVYYTPEPVVSFIVRSVDHLLKDRFGCPEGLADHQKIEHSVKRNGEEVDEESHKVLVLDPACGTGTFLYFVIDLIRQRFMERGEAGMWSDYVRDHLLPRVFGFELLMAPYAMAHLKLGLQLAGVDLPSADRQQWSYDFLEHDRMSVYMTNTLEEAQPREVELWGPMQIITEEANEATRVKRDLPILVVLGNPPYSGHSSNQGDWIRNLVYDYKRDYPDLNKPGQAKWLQDDYVKFIRWAQWRIEDTGAGIVAFISNHGYLTNPTFRGMREKLLRTFDEMFIVNLHGNAKRQESVPEDVQQELAIGDRDQNVFDIQQGVAIGIFVKRSQKRDFAHVYHKHIWGLRDQKYQWLLQSSLASIDWAQVKPDTQYFVLEPTDPRSSEYNQLWNLRDIMNRYGDPAPGIVTTQDQFAISWTKEESIEKVERFISTDSETEAREQWRLCSQYQWNYDRAKSQLSHSNWQNRVIPILYRPFDVRWTVYDSNVAVHRRDRAMRHMLAGPNIGLISARSNKSPFPDHVFCSRLVTEAKTGESTTQSYLFPLYLYPTEADTNAGESDADFNLNLSFLTDVSKKLGLESANHKRGDLQTHFGPEDILHYIYAILHSPTYRERYQEFLKIDFPRVPLTSNLDLFRTLCQKGADLVALHLTEADYDAASWNQDEDIANPFQNVQVRYPVRGEDVVEKGHPKYAAPGTKVKGEDDPIPDGRVYISESKPTKGKQGQYFEGVPPEVWEFQVGGYQVCEKWLKDRKGRKLSYDDREHYKRIVMALGETIRLMSEIDEAIDEHGGWPIE